MATRLILGGIRGRRNSKDKEVGARGTPLHCPWDPGHGDREEEEEVGELSVGAVD